MVLVNLKNVSIINNFINCFEKFDLQLFPNKIEYKNCFFETI